MLNIRLEILNEVQFSRTFRRLDENFKDLSPIWDDVRDAFWEIQEDQFQSECTKGRTGRWQKLSPQYEKQKIARYGTFAVIAGVLRATDEMYKTFTRQMPDTVYQKSKTGMVIGAGGKVGQRAKYHQTGAGRLPKREIISLSEQNKKTLTKTIQKKLVKQIRRSGVYVATDREGF